MRLRAGVGSVTTGAGADPRGAGLHSEHAPGEHTVNGEFSDKLDIRMRVLWHALPQDHPSLNPKVMVPHSP